MSDTNYNAFSTLNTKANANKAYRVRASVRIDTAGDEPAVVLVLPLKEIAQARPGSGQRRSLGFALGPVEFTIPDGNGYTAGTYQLYAPWVSLTTR